MYSLISAYAVNYIISLVFYTLPAALIALCYASQRKDRIALLLATYAPALNTLVASDLSRFLVVTSLSAVIGVLFMQSTRPAVPTRSVLWCWPITALLFALPLIYAFYDNAYIPLATMGFGDTPWANVIRSEVIPWYNREALCGSALWCRSIGHRQFQNALDVDGVGARCKYHELALQDGDPVSHPREYVL